MASADDATGPVGTGTALFEKVQVVSAFPAHIDPAKGTVTRVCGAPVQAKAPVLEANGVELTVNLVSTDLAATGPKCNPDRDLGVREGDFIEQKPVTQGPGLQTISASAFELTVDCYEPRFGLQDPTACSTSAFGGGGAAKALHYRAVAPARCDPTMALTWQNVAILVDHSGSTSGNLWTDTGDCTTATLIKEDVPDKVQTPKALTECASDRFRALAAGATSLIDALNPQDRVLTLYFDEASEGVHVACTDDLRCQTSGFGPVELTSTACVTNEECADLADSSGQKGTHKCAADPSFAHDTFANLSPGERLQKCFGKSEKIKAWNKLGLAERTSQIGTGRAPVYEAVSTASTFLRDQDLGGGAPRHIVLLTDGPDSCTYSDLFQFVDPKAPGGACRKPCAMSTADYQALRQLLHDAKVPVHVHVIQLQSKPHPQPDAYLQDLACRTEGTYQFINTLDMNANDPSAVHEAMSRSVAMVRYSLAGNWRVGFADDRFKDGAIKNGAMTALRGSMTLKSTVFSSLQAVFDNEKEWQFSQAGVRDRRMLFHLACTSDADCGGSSACAAHHCSPAGECVSDPAPDLLPCGADGKGRCCGGTCKADGACAGVCKG